MTTKQGKGRDRGFGFERLKKETGLEGSGVFCHRCHNEILMGGGVYFHPKDRSEWIIFCRFDCAKLHLGKHVKLYTRDQYCAQLVDRAIKTKAKES